METKHSTKELRRQVSDLDGKMCEIAKKIRELEMEIAEAESEFKAGDKITWRFGKGRRQGIIQSVLKGGHFYVRVILKSGADGALCKVYSWDKVERAEVGAA